MRDARRLRLRANSFELLVAALCILTAAAYFLEPHFLQESPVGRLLDVWRYLWLFGLTVAASGILAGLWFGRGNIEVAGLVALSAVAAIQALALITTVGFTAMSSIAVFVAVTWACLARARTITGE